MDTEQVLAALSRKRRWTRAQLAHAAMVVGGYEIARSAGLVGSWEQLAVAGDVVGREALEAVSAARKAA